MSRIDKAIELATKKLQGPNLPPEEQAEMTRHESSSHSLAAAGFDRLAPLPIENPMIAPLVEPNGVAAEQYKKLRSLIIRKSGPDNFRNSLLVTSAVAGEGKSLTAMNLALSLARTNDYSVVLVDTDLRNPQLHRLLNIQPATGLVHYLRNEVPIEAIMHKVGLGNFCLIPAGEQLSDPLEFLTSKRMQTLMADLRGRYHDRYVVLDTPPLLPFADSRVLGEMVDNIVFVCREGYSNMVQIEEGLEAISEFNLLGIVCNDTRLSQGADYSHYYGIK